MKNRCTFALELHLEQRRVDTRKRAGFFVLPQAIKGDLASLPCKLVMGLLPLKRCSSTGKRRGRSLLTLAQHQILSTMNYTEKGIEAKPSNLTPDQANSLAEISDQFFKDFDPDTVVDYLNELHHHYMGSDDYVDVNPIHRVNLAFTIHRLSEMLHRLHRIHSLTPKNQ